MSLGTWLFVYVLGGITFIPLLLITAFAALLYLSPPVGDSDPSKLAKDKLLDEATAEAETEKHSISTLPKPLQGWIIVRRTFDEPPQDNASYVGNLMRSYLASKQSLPSGSTSNVRRPRDTFYAVLKGTVLYLYEDEACSDCWAALQVSAYDVDIVGPEDHKGTRTKPMTDGELFAKRNAIRLRAEGSESETGSRGMNAVSKDMDATETKEKEKEAVSLFPRADEHYIFVKANVQMEDWYIALVHASTCSTTSSASSSLDPLGSLEPIFSPHDMNHLVRTLDQQPDPIPMRWLNALLGRLFFSLYRTAGLEANLIGRIMKKIAKVPRPAFLTDLSVKEVNVGNTAPLLSKPMLKELTREGDAAVEMGLSYKSRDGEHSGVRITVEATVTIDLKESLPLNLGNRFDLKPRTVKLVLAVVLRSLEGNLVVRVKRPPSNRLWYGFTAMPKMEVELLPIVSDRKIKWGMVLKPIENLLREVIQESVVLPNMDDIPFFDTEQYEHRGGIFNDAVRTVYEMSSTSATADPSTAVSTADGTKITTVPPSTDIPVSAELDVRTDPPSSSDTPGPIPGELSDVIERSDTTVSQPHLPVESSVLRTGTTASLPAAMSASPKRMSWLPRRFVKGADVVAVATGQSEATILRDAVITEDKMKEDKATTELEYPDESSENATPNLEANPTSEVSTNAINQTVTPSAPEVEDGSNDDRKPDESLDKMSHASTRNKVEVASASTPIFPPTPPPLPPRQRSGTLGQPATDSPLPSTSATGTSTPSLLSQQRPETPSTPGTTAIPSTPARSLVPNSNAEVRSTPPTSPVPQSQTATQALLTAWKNRSSDKQALANTARDVARDTMKKWGFGVKKDAVETALAAQSHGRSPSVERIASSSRPSTPETKKTFEQMRQEVAERKDRRGSIHGGGPGQLGSASPQQDDSNDVFVEDNLLSADDPDPNRDRSQSTGALNASLQPMSPKPTTGIHRSPGPLSSSQPPRLPTLEPPFELGDRDRRLSSTSQDSAGRVPVQRQPSQGAMMRIPGIHASHRGDVMSMGYSPAVPEEHEVPRTLGPKTTATLQSMYRLFQKQAPDSDSPMTSSSEHASGVDTAEPSSSAPAFVETAQSASETVPLALPPRETPNENQPHSRSTSGSSAASALKQIQALDAQRDAERKSVDNSRPVSRRTSLARREASENLPITAVDITPASNPVIV